MNRLHWSDFNESIQRDAVAIFKCQEIPKSVGH